MTEPTNIVTSSTYGIDPAKAEALDRDRVIPLTESLAAIFVRKANETLAQSKTLTLLADGKAEAFAKAITENRYFPFTATVEDGVVVLSSDFRKSNQRPVLKDVSDGFTKVYKDLVGSVQVSDYFKVALTQLIQPALYDVYVAAGMEEGPHTKYTLRSC